MIHKSAIIDPKAKISSNVKIGPYSIIGPNVEIHENSEIQSHVSIIGNTKIGKNNKIYPFSSIGNDPQDLKYKGEATSLIIGENNTIREHVTINTGTAQGGGLTKVGNNNLIKPGAKVAKPGTGDICFISDKNVLEWKKIFLRNNIKIEQGPIKQVGASGNLYSIYIRDPDENLIEISNKV